LIERTSATPLRSSAWMKRSGAVTMPQCLATAPVRIRKRSSAPGTTVVDGSSIITDLAASASGSRVPLSPQSRLSGGIGIGSGP
jgi:hypothetical protein